MTDRSTVSQITQIGVEATPGTSVPANKQLLAVSITPQIKPKVNNFRPMGSKFATVAALGQEWVEAKIAGIGVYTDFIYLMTSAFSYAAPTQIIPSTGLAYEWDAAIQQSAPDTYKTFTVEQGSSVRAGKFTNGIVTELGYKLDREKMELSGTMLGQAYQDGITLTATPTAIPQVPILPSDVDVFLDDTGAGIGTTKLTRAFSLDFSIKDRFGPVWPLNSANASFDGVVEKALKPQLKLLVEADSSGMGLLTKMRAGAFGFIRVAATGAQIEAGPPANSYLWQHDMCVAVTDASELKDQDGVYAIEWTLDVNYDATWGKAMAMKLINKLSAL